MKLLLALSILLAGILRAGAVQFSVDHSLRYRLEPREEPGFVLPPVTRSYSDPAARFRRESLTLFMLADLSFENPAQFKRAVRAEQRDIRMSPSFRRSARRLEIVLQKGRPVRMIRAGLAIEQALNARARKFALGSDPRANFP